MRQEIGQEIGQKKSNNNLNVVLICCRLYVDLNLNLEPFKLFFINPLRQGRSRTVNQGKKSFLGTSCQRLLVHPLATLLSTFYLWLYKAFSPGCVLF